jgi:hypothetical protein
VTHSIQEQSIWRHTMYAMPYHGLEAKLRAPQVRTTAAQQGQRDEADLLHNEGGVRTMHMLDTRPLGDQDGPEPAGHAGRNDEGQVAAHDLPRLSARWVRAIGPNGRDRLELRWQSGQTRFTAEDDDSAVQVGA